jgi:hypothetical protein
MLLDGSTMVSGDAADTGLPDAQGSAVALAEQIDGLSADTPYHWRLRTVSRSPFFPHSPWLSPAGNGRQETDLRTAATGSGVGDGVPCGAQRVRCFPNPFNPQTTLLLDLPSAATVLLTIHEISGRRVATLVDGRLAAGRHEIPWAGRDAAGRPLAAGLYLYRFAAEGRQEGGKLVLLK